MVVTVCQHLIVARNDRSRLGLLHVCIFILLHLSGERPLGVSMNKPIDASGPVRTFRGKTVKLRTAIGFIQAINLKRWSQEWKSVRVVWRVSTQVPPAELGLVVGVSTGADLIVCTVYKMLSDSDPAAQASLADVCLTIICNLSPYTKSFGKAC